MTVETDRFADLVEQPLGAPAIPSLRFRRWAGPDDLPTMHDVAEAAKRANGDHGSSTLEQMRLDYAHLTNCDPTQDVLLAFVGSVLVAYGRCTWEDRHDGVRSYASFGFVHPDWRRRGIGSALQRWLEARNVAIGATHATDRPRLLASWGDDVDLGSMGVMAGAGYTVERRFVHMVRPHLDAIAVPPLPDGLVSRPATLDDARALFEGDAEAFADHWGSTDASDEAWIRFRDRPGLDPMLWVMAWDGDQVAGAVQLEIDPVADGETDPRNGWLGRVWVRRPWRKRGLARALIGRSLLVLRDRGLDGAQLFVDVDNAQRALDLYTDAGFATQDASSAWRKAWPVPVPVPDGDPMLLGWRRR